MAKSIQQFRFYNNENKTQNQPSNISQNNLVSGSIFFQNTSLGSITQLGIQALPGTKFYLNNSATPIIIGFTGIYELDLEGISEITSISFDRDSLSAINNINNAYLIVDAIYNIEEG